MVIFAVGIKVAVYVVCLSSAVFVVAFNLESVEYANGKHAP